MKLLKAIRERHPQLSQRRARALLKAKKIRLNGRLARITDRVRPSDRVEIPAEHLGSALIPNPDLRVALLKETPDFLFLLKPAGVHSIANDFEERDSVANWLAARDPGLSRVDPLECGLAHRLDFDTSGVMAAARNKDARAFLRDAFARKLVEKIYVCRVSGGPVEKGVLSAYAAPSSKTGKRVRLSLEPVKGPKLLMEVLSCRAERGSHRLTIKLITGFRHQIRAHLALLKRPVLGDSLYGGKPAKRLMLHARSLRFDHGGREYSVSSPSRFPG